MFFLVVQNQGFCDFFPSENHGLFRRAGCGFHVFGLLIYMPECTERREITCMHLGIRWKHSLTHWRSLGAWNSAYKSVAKKVTVWTTKKKHAYIYIYIYILIEFRKISKSPKIPVKSTFFKAKIPNVYIY